MVSSNWWSEDIIWELEQVYQSSEGVKGIEFRPIEVDKQSCNYDIGRFIMFYGDIIDRLRIGPPFTHFQVELLKVINICPSQLTWNAWAFILYFEVICIHLKIKPSLNLFSSFLPMLKPRVRDGPISYNERIMWLSTNCWLASVCGRILSSQLVPPKGIIYSP